MAAVIGPAKLRKGQQLNIKDTYTVRLAREIAARNGQSVTAVIRHALEREEAARQDEIERKIDGAYSILEGVREMWKPETQNMTLKEIMDSIYDDDQPDGFAQ